MIVSKLKLESAELVVKRLLITIYINKHISLEGVSLADLLRGDRNENKLSKELVCLHYHG